MDESVKKIRGSLNTMSVAIILYMWAGGHLGTEEGKGKASFFGGSITLDHPEYLEVVAFLIFVYLGVRWVLHSYDVLRQLRANFIAYFSTRPFYLNFSLSKMPQNSYLTQDERKAQILRNLPELGHQFIRGEIEKHRRVDRPPYLNRFIFPTSLIYNQGNVEVVFTGFSWGNVFDNGDGKIQLSFKESLVLTIVFMISAVKFIFLWEKLYDLVVPYLLAVTAIYFLVTKSDKGLGHIWSILVG